MCTNGLASKLARVYGPHRLAARAYASCSNGSATRYSLARSEIFVNCHNSNECMRLRCVCAVSKTNIYTYEFLYTFIPFKLIITARRTLHISSWVNVLQMLPVGPRCIHFTRKMIQNSNENEHNFSLNNCIDLSVWNWFWWFAYALALKFNNDSSSIIHSAWMRSIQTTNERKKKREQIGRSQLCAFCVATYRNLMHPKTHRIWSGLAACLQTRKINIQTQRRMLFMRCLY